MISRILSIVVVSLAVCACKSNSQVITVSNPASVHQSAMAQIGAAQVKKFASPFKILDDCHGEVSYQILHDGSLIFPADVAPGAERKYRVVKGNPEPVKARVYGRKYPEHKDNMNWENDRSAYVAYGPALQDAGERGFGYDVWTKSVDTLVIEMRNHLRHTKKVSLHKDHGNGMDVYTVANTLGAGTAAMLDDNGEIIFPWAWSEYEILDCGPLRFSVSLTYRPISIGGDEGVVENRIITLDAGSDLNHTVVTYNGLTHPHSIAPGIVVHEQNPDGYILDNARSILAYADSTDNAKNGNGVIYIGVIVPEGKANGLIYKPIVEPTKQAVGHILAPCPYSPGDKYVYYWGSAWSKHPLGPQSPEQWMERLRHHAEAIAHPLIVNVK